MNEDVYQMLPFSRKRSLTKISRDSLTKGSDTFMTLCMSFRLRFPNIVALPPYLWSSASETFFQLPPFPVSRYFLIQVALRGLVKEKISISLSPPWE